MSFVVELRSSHLACGTDSSHDLFNDRNGGGANLGSKPSQRFSVGAPVAKMVRISVLRDCLNNIVNAEKRGKRQVLIRPNSKVIIKFLQVMQKHGYIGDLEIIDDHRAGKVVVELIGRINKCGVISPRFDAARLTLVAK